MLRVFRCDAAATRASCTAYSAHRWLPHARYDDDAAAAAAEDNISSGFEAWGVSVQHGLMLTPSSTQDAGWVEGVWSLSEQPTVRKRM